MTKIDIISGFLGAGKTTLIKKLLKEALAGQKVALIENEFGEIGVDGGFLQDSGIEIKEMNSGCICCSLVGDFGTSLKEVMDTYTPERIIIEPSGVGKLSDVMKAVQKVIDETDSELNSAVAVVDASKCKMYIKNFGEFFINQIEHAGTIILSRTGNISDDKLKVCMDLIREHNEKATIVTTPWDMIEGEAILKTMEGASDFEAEVMAELMEHHHDHDHEHEHHHDHGPDCTCGCHDHEHEHDHDHDHEHHHDHGPDCTCGCHDHEHEHDHEHHHDHEHDHEHEHHHDHEHEHHHDHDHEHHHDHGPDCTCGCHDHDHHHHHADEVFTSWGIEGPTAYSKEEIEAILKKLEDEENYGMILRAKGMVPDVEGGFIYFDYVPEESNVRAGKPDVTGKLCVIGAQLKEDNLKALFSK